MRITDLPVSVPVGSPARTGTKKTESGGSSPTVVASSKADGASHPDEVAATKLHKAAAAAAATKVVAAQNQLASQSAQGDLDPARLAHA